MKSSIGHTGHQISINMRVTVDKAMLMRNPRIEQDPVEEIYTFIEDEHVLVTDLEIDAQFEQTIGVGAGNGCGVIGLPVAGVDRLAEHGI